MNASSTSPDRISPGTESLVGNYFVAAYPPFSTWVPSQVGLLEEHLGQKAGAHPVGLYVHVPFCEQKCDYCYYLSYARKPERAISDYLEAVLAELELYAQTPALKNRNTSFVYFGGGTPSILTASQIRLLGDGLRNLCSWREVREVTFECAPKSVRSQTLEALHDIGVTRVSMGIQSFDDDLLRLNGRIHRRSDTLRAYSLIRESGFRCVNVDLMVGLLGESSNHWKDSVRRVKDLAPDSVTIYQTEIPYNTKSYRDLAGGRLAAAPVSWEEKRERLRYGFEELEQEGYVVVSGYTAVKDPIQHRFAYQDELWTGGDMLGLGVASFSYLGGIHFQNVNQLTEYKARVREDRIPVHRAWSLSAEERLVREFVLQLKWGVVRREGFQRKFGEDILERFRQPLSELAAQGWLVVSDAGVRLTRSGLSRVDALLPFFYLKEHQDVTIQLTRR